VRAARSRAAATAGPGNYRRGLEAGGGACCPPYAAAGSAQTLSSFLLKVSQSLSRKLCKLGKRPEFVQTQSFHVVYLGCTILHIDTFRILAYG
jgi:hypothetical protein